MDEAVDVLARQIPQHCLTLSAMFSLCLEFINDPELLAVSGSVLLELPMR